MPELRERIRIADKAGEEFAQDSVLYRAIEDLGDEYVREWRNSMNYDAEKREAIFHKMNALSEVRAAIERRIADGPVAKAELNRREGEERAEDINYRAEDNDDA